MSKQAVRLPWDKVLDSLVGCRIIWQEQGIKYQGEIQGIELKKGHIKIRGTKLFFEVSLEWTQCKTKQDATWRTITNKQPLFRAGVWLEKTPLGWKICQKEGFIYRSFRREAKALWQTLISKMAWQKMPSVLAEKA